MHRLKSFIVNLYGVYAAVACAGVVLISGALILGTPGVARRRRIARRGLRIAFFCAGMPFRVRDTGRLPEETCIVIANHRSYLDGLVLIAALPARFTPVIKVEVSSLPVIGLILQRIGARFVQREPAMSAGDDTKHLLDALEENESLAVFPEGTFSVDDGLLPFREGAFFLAAKSATPIAPVAIEGTRGVLPVGRMLPRPAAVTVQVLDKLAADDSDRVAAETLRDQTEDVLWHGLRPRAPMRPGHAPDYNYYRRVFADRSLPLAYLDLDLLENNIRTVLERSGGKRLRIDARALSCATAIDRVMRSNIRFHGVKCATAHEAVYLAREWELPDVLVAYPTLQRAAVDAVCAALATGCDITLTADSNVHLDLLAEAAANADVTLPVCIEMDLSWQRISRRSPLRTSDDLLRLVAQIEAHRNLRFRGVLAFDTQPANIPAWFASPRGRRRFGPKWSANAKRLMHQRREEILAKLRTAGHGPDMVNGDGSGALEFNAADPNISEITVGAALFAPEFGHDDFEHAPAAGFAAELMRRPRNDRYACLGGGYTAADTLDPKGLPRPFLPSEAVLDVPEGAGEAHIPIHYEGPLRLGDPVFLRPPNAGELCERFSHLLLVQDGVVVDVAPTYRALGERLQ